MTTKKDKDSDVEYALGTGAKPPAVKGDMASVERDVEDLSSSALLPPEDAGDTSHDPETPIGAVPAGPQTDPAGGDSA